ncbi:TetR/AcrR family transcriptional regulator [Xanthomonas arboricola]|nr:TetR/AcrR family transcriptional regulator [Xanthomonas campestris pv. esculenti]
MNDLVYGMVTNSRLPRLSKDERTEHIVDVAVQLFAQNGYGQTSMSSIAARLGGSKATLYKYFSSRQALFETAMIQCCDEVFGEFPEVDPIQRGVSSYLIDTGVVILSGMLNPRALEITRLVFSEGSRHPEIADIFYKKCITPTYALIANGLAHFHSSGIIVCPDPLKAARNFVGMIREDIHLSAICGLGSLPQRSKLEAHVRQAADTLLAGLTTSEKSSN